jgi:D-inositol-3-phosphate glycosyltransferase
MKKQLVEEFALRPDKISEIPLGLNDTVPTSALTSPEARNRMGISQEARVLLFFGRISPYKGVEYLIDALAAVCKRDEKYRLLLVGSLQNCPEYWKGIQKQIADHGLASRVITRIEFIPDDATELYFKGADVLVLPYAEVFQSGVLVLAYRFGLPVIAADVGSFRDEVVEGETGYIFRAKDAEDLARTIERYFSSALYRELEQRRSQIKGYAGERYSWAKVGEVTQKVYRSILEEGLCL